MMKFLIKWFSPIVYVGFLIPISLAIIIFTVAFINKANYLFGLNGGVSDFLMRLISFVFVLLIFWFANEILKKIEKLARLSAGDHYRQSAACYAVALGTVIDLYINGGFRGGLGEGVLVVIFLIAMWAIIINAIYIFWSSRRPPATSPSSVLLVGIKPLSTKIVVPIFFGPVLIGLLLAVGYYLVRDYSQIWQLKRAGDISYYITPRHLEFNKPVTVAEALRILGPKNEIVEEILFSNPYDQGGGGVSVRNGNVQGTMAQLDKGFAKFFQKALAVQPAVGQMLQNIPDREQARKSLEALEAAQARDQATLEYFKLHGVPISGVNFKVSPGQAKAFGLLLFVAFVWLVFWFSNKALIQLAQPSTSDHYRQSAIFYAIILAAFLKTVFFNEHYFGFNNRMAWAILSIFPVAIIINAVYVYRRRRTVLITPFPTASPTATASPSANKVGLSIFVGPALLGLLMIVGYYVTTMHNRIYYSKNDGMSSDGVAPPGTPFPPSLSDTDKLPTSTMINASGLSSPSSDLDYSRR